MLFDATEVFEDDERNILLAGLRKAFDAVIGSPDWLTIMAFEDWKHEYHREAYVSNDVHDIVEWMREHSRFQSDVARIKTEHRVAVFTKNISTSFQNCP